MDEWGQFWGRILEWRERRIWQWLHIPSTPHSISTFIEGTESIYFSKQLKISKDIYQLLEYDSLLKNLKTILPPKVYDKHIIQYNLGKRDYDKVLLEQEQGIVMFEVFYNGKVDDNHENDMFVNEEDPIMPQNRY